MPSPKTFSTANATGERYTLDPAKPGHVLVYRFADKAKATDWRSRRRNTVGGGFAKPSDSVLNDWALKQSSYGSQSENANDNPFLSVATDYEALYGRAEGWVKKILETAPDLGVFSVPGRVPKRGVAVGKRPAAAPSHGWRRRAGYPQRGGHRGSSIESG
ncbi:hypothetical protein, partial [Azospirillum brasilense]|uniref:hypothetical protein n=1 Tax=Azospirillum brasilense TaxID=192 RepID=UPI001B3C0AC0